MGDKDNLLAGKNLLWLVVIAVIVAVIVIIVVRRREHDEDHEGHDHEAHETLAHHGGHKNRRTLLIIGGVAAAAIVLYGLWYYGYLSMDSEHYHVAVGRRAHEERREERASSRSSRSTPSSLRSQSARGVRSPPRQSPFLTNEERKSASIRSPARGSLSSLSTESNL